MQQVSPTVPAPLEGVKIVDMGQVLATPFGTYLMGLLGAEVIKIESASGEFMRRSTRLAFATQNAGKRPIVVNMREPGAAEVVLRLIEQADVFVEGFAPGTADAMGLSWETVSARNPNIVYGSLSAFGDVGPYGGRPGFDHVVQAMSGIMYSTGFADHPPIKVGSPYLDYGGGLLLAFGLLAGVLEQRRTGTGVHVDVTMLDAGLLFNASGLVRTAETKTSPPRTGNDAFSGAVASGAFETTDGLLMVAANKARHLVDLMTLLDLPDFADPGLTEPDADPAMVAAAKAAMAQRFSQKSAAEWEELLNARAIPAGRVRDLAEVMASPAARAMTLESTIDGQHTRRIRGNAFQIGPL